MEQQIKVQKENTEQNVNVQRETLIVNTSGTSDYNELQNKPSINGTTLTGEMSSEDFDVYTKDTVDTLLEGKQATGDYATNEALTTGLKGKADVKTTYSKTEVDDLISSAIADVSSLIGGAS